MNPIGWRDSVRSRTLAMLRASCSALALVLWLIGATSCNASPSSAEKASKATVDEFWSSTDDTIHDVQSSLREARRVGNQIGAEAAKGEYEQIIAVGHSIGGLGHDHVMPEAKPPVIPMLDSMTVSIDALLKVASSPAELDEAEKATVADLSKLSPRTLRLYHLLSAKKKVAGVRSRATAIGFRPPP